MTDIKHSLRKFGFPQCVREALSYIEQLTIGHLNRKSVQKPMELANEIMSEFIFKENSSDNKQQFKPLTAFQELQLLNVLSEYFQCGRDTDFFLLNTIFMYLFPEQVQNTTRGRILIKLISIAISNRNRPVLNAAATWMQQLGPTSRCCLEVARGLVTDYFILLPESVDKLADLSVVAPQFTLNFVTAMAELYGGSTDSLPPTILLKTVIGWLTCPPGTGLLSALNSQSNTLPFGGIPMLAVTPFAGLFRWCVIAPLSGNDDTKLLYSQLQLALMESLLQQQKMQQVVSTMHMVRVITTFKAELTRHNLHTSAVNVQTSLDRLGQAVLVVLHSNCLYDNRQELFKQLDSLPENRLVSMVSARFRAIT